MMKWYPWLRSSFEHLVAQYQARRGHHALLIHALPGMGDDALIYALSRWLMCQQPEDKKSCGHCHGCQLMQAGTHPDYYLLKPEKGKASLGIDAIRDISEKWYECARLGGAKVVWISDVAILTDAAANALLKTVEEPPENTWFLLGCHEPKNVLATLRSRCFYWHIPVPDECYGLAWLAKITDVPPETRCAALRLCGGAPAAAQALLADNMYETRESVYSSLMDVLHQQDLLALLSVLHHDNVPDRLYWLSSLLLDALKWQQGAAAFLTNTDQRDRVMTLAEQCSGPRLQAIIYSLFRCREQLLHIAGVNRELLLTDLLLSWEKMREPSAACPTFPV